MRTFRHKVTHQGRTGPGNPTGMGGISPNLSNIKNDCFLTLLGPYRMVDTSVSHTLTRLNITKARCQKHARTISGGELKYAKIYYMLLPLVPRVTLHSKQTPMTFFFMRRKSSFSRTFMLVAA